MLNIYVNILSIDTTNVLATLPCGHIRYFINSQNFWKQKRRGSKVPPCLSLKSGSRIAPR